MAGLEFPCPPLSEGENDPPAHWPALRARDHLYGALVHMPMSPPETSGPMLGNGGHVPVLGFFQNESPVPQLELAVAAL